MRKLLAVAGLSAGLILAAPTTAAAAAPKLPTEATITVEWSEDSTSVDVTSSKDLSNVVLEDCLGVQYKHDNLDDGKTGTFEHPSGLAITTVWVKSGNNKSGDGPGYGERFDNPDEVTCGTTTTTEPPEEIIITTDPPTTTTTTTTTTTAPPVKTEEPTPVVPLAAPVEPAPVEELPVTGSAVLPLALLGVAAVILGSGILLAKHRKSSPVEAE